MARYSGSIVLVLAIITRTIRPRSGLIIVAIRGRGRYY